VTSSRVSKGTEIEKPESRASETESQDDGRNSLSNHTKTVDGATLTRIAAVAARGTNTDIEDKPGAAPGHTKRPGAAIDHRIRNP